MKKGFSLLTAIVFIVLIATIGALALSFSTQTSKQTSDVYLKAQAELLAKSATEYALLALSAHDHRINCVETITATHNNMFNILMELRYIGVPTGWTCNNVLVRNIATDDSDLTVIIDTYVTSMPNVPIAEQIRIHRRTLQKP